VLGLSDRRHPVGVRHLLGVIPTPTAMIGIGDIASALLRFWSAWSLNPARLWRLKREHIRPRRQPGDRVRRHPAALIGLTRDNSFAAAIAIGMPLALSSTAQVLPFLRSTGEINTRTGERAFSVLLLRIWRSCRC
jgi:CPA2 family monovalent cation:H+ antiporter-2/glutathione-regulated potassium-efflux system protein KefB